MDYDKVIVMDKGKVVEYDEPYILIVNDINDNGITRDNGFLA
jgi:ABC-type multidrug transport system fused ATPase/permease subunit